MISVGHTNVLNVVTLITQFHIKVKNHLQVQWVEKENQIFALVVRKANFFECRVDNSSGLEIWGRLLNLSSQKPRTCIYSRTTYKNFTLH